MSTNNTRLFALASTSSFFPIYDLISYKRHDPPRMAALDVDPATLILFLFIGWSPHPGLELQ